MRFGGIFDYAAKHARLAEVTLALEDPELWKMPEQAQALGRERTQLSAVVDEVDHLQANLDDLKDLLDLAIAEQDEVAIADVVSEVEGLAKTIAKLEFQCMFSDPLDKNNAYMEIQSGSGGTEAQDWAEMLLRMYLRWGDRHGFKTELMDTSHGDVAGIKGVTLKFTGNYAYGWLRTETGVHRLVRKSPFDSGNRRHTSFAAVFVTAEIDESIEVDINPADLRIDTYRSSGAGGQHVNTTDSAVRITHVPTNTVVQCQNERSQHKNKDQALKQLRAKLYELKRQEQHADQQLKEESKSDITWGSQIRSYVLDASRIKDLRTGVETTNTQAVLDGDIDLFIEASLKNL